MCDERDLASWAHGKLTRRAFGGSAIAFGAVACAATEPSAGGGGAAQALAEHAVTFAGPEGTMDGLFIHPATGRHPAIILWPDIGGIRPAKREMARRLAGEGYAVLLANPYYRDVAGQQFEDFADFAGNGGWDRVKPWRSRFTAETIRVDTVACAEWLAEQTAVDSDRGIGVQGYCMTGSFALLAPWASDRVAAGASFHGGGLVRDSETSPHRLLRADAHYLVAIARNDDERAPGDAPALEEAARAAGTDAEIEVYAADHGWCVPDSPAYDQAEAERAWGRLLATYDEAL